MNSKIYSIIIISMLLFLRCLSQPSFQENSKHVLDILYPIQVNKMWGFINNKGHNVIKPQYNHAFSIEGGLGIVEIGKYSSAVVDFKGNIVLNFDGYIASGFNNGLALAHKLEGRRLKFGYINKYGATVIPFQDWIFALSFHDGLALVNEKHNIGYINTNGRYVIPPKYDQGRSFYEGLAAVRIGEKWGYIDNLGNNVIEFQFTKVSDFHECFAKFTFDDNFGLTQRNWGYIDKNGKIAIEAKYESAKDFSEGLAPVSVIVGRKEQWGYINKEGGFVIKPKFDNGNKFKEGFAPVRVGKLWGYINKDGNYLISPVFNSAGPFKGGLALVTRGKIKGYINRNGGYVWKTHN